MKKTGLFARSFFPKPCIRVFQVLSHACGRTWVFAKGHERSLGDLTRPISPEKNQDVIMNFFCHSLECFCHSEQSHVLRGEVKNLIDRCAK